MVCDPLQPSQLEVKKLSTELKVEYVTHFCTTHELTC